MKNPDIYKIIDGICYAPSWVETFRRFKVGQEVRLTKEQATYNVARSATQYLAKSNPGVKYSIIAHDHYQNSFTVRRVS